MQQTILSYVPPLFLYTIVFIGGVVWQAHTVHFIYLLIPIGILSILYLSSFLPDKKNSIIPWFMAAFSIGAFRHTLQEYYHLSLAEQLCNKKISVQGIVVNKETTNKSSVTSVTIAVQSFTASSSEVATTEEQPHIKLYCMQPVSCEYGDIICMENLYLKPPKSNYSPFFKKQGIIATGYAGKQQPFTIQQQQAPLQWFYKKREQLIKKFATILSPRTFMLLSSIFLGYKMERNKTRDIVYEQFQWWGISHYLARSGLHLVMFVIILHLLFMWLPIPFFLKQITITGCIALYMLLSWSSISFLRSLLMIFCYLLCSLLKMQQHALHTISLACCALLLYNPSYLFALDFQLSFSLTLALILLHQAHVIQKNSQNAKALLE